MKNPLSRLREAPTLRPMPGPSHWQAVGEREERRLVAGSEEDVAPRIGKLTHQGRLRVGAQRGVPHSSGLVSIAASTICV